MKISKLYMAPLAAMASMAMLTACQDDVDAPKPQTPVATIEANTSIIDLKKAYWNNEANYIDTVRLAADGSHVVVAGRVISSDRAGNIYKSLVIQDETAALAISIDRSSLYNEYRVGQEVVIDVTDMYIGKYSSLQQLGYPDYSGGYGWQATFMPYEMFASHAQLNGNPEPAAIDTITTTIADLSTTADGLMKMQSQLVRLNNVHFADGGTARFCTAHKVNTNRDLLDENGNTIVVRTSGYATFWSDTIPEGSGDVVGILSYNGSGSSAKWQLLLRERTDLMNFGNPTLPSGTATNPISVSEAIAIQQTGSSEALWTKGYIVGAVRAEVTEVKSADDIEWTAPTEMNNTLVIGETADTKDIARCLVMSLPQGSSIRENVNLRDHADMLGKEIRVYGVPAEYMSTFGITGNRGTASEYAVEGFEPEGSGIPAGEGTEASPYNPAQVVGMGTSATATGVWLKGYIVGWVNNASQNWADDSNSMFETPATVATNVLVATTPDVKSYSQCVVVNLPNSNNIRAQINLVDNPGNLGKAVLFHGNISKYFNMPGFREVTEARLEGGSTPGQPTGPTDPVTSLDVDFEGVTALSQLKGWTAPVVSGNKDWFFRSYNNNSFAEITAYNGTPGDNGFDAWLVTPALNIDGMAEKVLSFSSCVGYSGNGTLEVYAMTGSDPKTATLTRLSANIPQPTGSWGDFVASGEVSLAQFSGVIYIGFRYTAAAGSGYTTYRVDNVVVGKKAGSGGETPDPGTPETPVTGEGSADDPYTVSEVIALNPTSTSTLVKEGVWATGYIVGYVDTGKSSSASADNTVFSAEGAVPSNLLIAESASEKDLSKCVSVNLPSNSSVRKALNLKDNPSMLGQQVCVKGNIRLYVGIPGVHSVSEYTLGDKGK